MKAEVRSMKDEKYEEEEDNLELGKSGKINLTTDYADDPVPQLREDDRTSLSISYICVIRVICG